MIDGGDASYEEKKRQKDGVQDVISYCQDTVTCRRVQVLHHFGQDFNKAQCSKGCDNCNNDSAVVSEDMTDTAKAAIAIVKALLKNKHNVTKTIIGDILRGGNAKSVRDVSGEKLEQHGAAKHISRDKIGRLLDELLNNHVKGLKQIQKMNRGGFNNTYILVSPCSLDFKHRDDHSDFVQVGTEANQILSGHKRVAINFRVADKQATASAAPRSRKTKQAVIQPTGKGKGKAATNPHEPIESYDDEMQDFRDFDEDEIDNVPPPKNMRRTRSEPQPKASASAAVNKAGDQTVIHLDALRAWRGEVSRVVCIHHGRWLKGSISRWQPKKTVTMKISLMTKDFKCWCSCLHPTPMRASRVFSGCGNHTPNQSSLTTRLGDTVEPFVASSPRTRQHRHHSLRLRLKCMCQTSLVLHRSGPQQAA
jgi:hypothetical protein